MTLVDDIKGDAAKDKQFIVVQSRGGDYFYIIIDNAAECENRVHFLNQVNEADLLPSSTRIYRVFRSRRPRR